MFQFNDNKANTFTNMQMFILSAVVSAVLLFVNSKNSLLYEMNDYIDVNIFFSVTDALFHGKVLYRDIFEHKGPFLYFVYALIHILGNSYFTLWLFECVANALFVYFGTKTILLYDENATKTRIFLYALCLEFCLCTATSFMFGRGGVVEELFLWVASYGLYVTLRCIRNEQNYLNKELLLIGLLCGVLFWTKYALLGFYAGLALFVIVKNIAQKNLARLLKMIAIFSAGFAISSIPTVVYCTLTHSFDNMVNVYFIGNIFGNHVTPNASAHFYGLMNVIYKDITVVLLILLGSIFVLKKEPKSIKLLIIITIVPTFLASCCLKVFFPYYPLPMLLFLPFGFVALQEVKIRREFKFGIAALVILLHFCASPVFGLFDPINGNKINPLWLKEHLRVLAKGAVPLLLLYFAITNIRIIENKSKHAIGCICMLVICTLAGFGVRDPYYYTEQPLPQIRFGKTIRQTNHANILVYGSYDYGFFKSSHTYPQVKYFCNVNLSEDNTADEQISYIKNEVVDFVITRKSPQEMKDLFRDTTYKLIDTAESYLYNENTIIFYLYKKEIVLQAPLNTQSYPCQLLPRSGEISNTRQQDECNVIV